MDVDPKVKELMYATGIDEKLAMLLIQFTGGDVSGARKIIESMPKDFLVLKIRYMGHRTHNYGVILIVLNTKTKDIDDLYVIVDSKVEASQINAKASFEDFKGGIVKFIQQKNPDLEMIGRMREAINTIEFKEKIFNKLSKENKFDLEQLKVVFSELIFKVLTESNCAIKIEVEEVDLFRLHKSNDNYVLKGEEQLLGAEDEKNGKESTEVTAREEVHVRNISLVLLKVEPVLSPIRGIPGNEIQIGDQIMVKIIDEREIGDYLGNLLGGRKNKEVIPIPATINEISKQEDTGNLMVLVQFGPGIAGKMFIPPEIKIAAPILEEENEGKLGVLSFFRMNPVWVVLALVLLFIGFIILIFYMG
ncbi:MAG: DUF4899 domain-containing protein [Spirochaetes bacterium]|nr:DUF4899 domain-containing protein [Spirochaetota bacterium]